jgi:hypothetical protein
MARGAKGRGGGGGRTSSVFHLLSPIVLATCRAPDTLVRTKTSYEMDGAPFIVGIATVLKQLHPSVTQQVPALARPVLPRRPVPRCPPRDCCLLPSNSWAGCCVLSLCCWQMLLYVGQYIRLHIAAYFSG